MNYNCADYIGRFFFLYGQMNKRGAADNLQWLVIESRLLEGIGHTLYITCHNIVDLLVQNNIHLLAIE